MTRPYRKAAAPSGYLTESEAAAWLGVSPPHLGVLRRRESGPPHELRVLRGRDRVVYRLATLRRWAAGHGWTCAPPSVSV